MLVLSEQMIWIIHVQYHESPSVLRNGKEKYSRTHTIHRTTRIWKDEHDYGVNACLQCKSSCCVLQLTAWTYNWMLRWKEKHICTATANIKCKVNSMNKCSKEHTESLSAPSVWDLLLYEECTLQKTQPGFACEWIWIRSAPSLSKSYL